MTLNGNEPTRKMNGDETFIQLNLGAIAITVCDVSGTSPIDKVAEVAQKVKDYAENILNTVREMGEKLSGKN